ncbi:MAG: hypothetical protein HYX83_01815 [Chloroflexi bacterium]|nr:hypothetical protein [Chloroflexota bacterium]
MSLSEVRNYLEDVRTHLHLGPIAEKQVLRELVSYFHDKMEELKTTGLTEAKAAEEAIKSCGRARVVAQLTYEAYSQGSWAEATAASLPHLIAASLFAWHLWSQPVLSPVVFLAIVGVTLFGWWRGKPSWLYPWIGYSLAPLLVAVFISRDTIIQTVVFLFRGYGSVPPLWRVLPVVVLIGISLWVIIRTTTRVARRDWILASLMLVPLPILATWLYNIEQTGGFFSDNIAVHQWDDSLARVFIVLAIASIVFTRLRRRTFKIWALTILGAIAGAMAIGRFWGDIGFLGVLAASLLSLVSLYILTLLGSRVEREEEELELTEDLLEPASARK